MHLKLIFRKRIQALARAVYSRKEFIILDDVFSGLDSKTEDEVFHNLFGQGGLLKRVHATVLMASSDGEYSTSSKAAVFKTLTSAKLVVHHTRTILLFLMGKV